ncbi:MAG TPA: DUF2125 domain-containing protein [Dongiaceae bacterium]|nr:DUF2125 domain-containing protein [Dongiaceae bacterium]
MNRRTLLSAAAAAVALLLAGYSAYWWWMAERLETGLDAWIAAERQAGLAIDAERTPIGGYPFAFRATFRRPHVHGAIAGQPIDWQGADVEARLWPFDLTTLHLATGGRHRVAVGAAATSIDGGTIGADLRFDAGGRLSGVAADGANLTVTPPDGGGIAVQSATASFEVPAAAPRTDRDPLLQFSVAVSALTLPPGVQLLTAGPVDKIAVRGAVNGPMPAAPLRQALAAWRDQGGAVEIASFDAAQAPLSVTGSATIALDADLQPIVAADLRAQGLGPTVDLLAQQKRLATNDVLKAKLFIAATEHDAPGGGKEVATGLTIQSGYLSWGAFRLARVARIDWP